MRKFTETLLISCTVATLTGLAGCTTDASNISDTGATLNAFGACASGNCEYFFNVWPSDLGQGAGFSTTVRTVDEDPDTFGFVAEPVSGLGSHARYGFEACGRETSDPNFACNNQHEFVLALPAPVVTAVGASEVTDTARLYVKGSPHGLGHQQDGITIAFGYIFVAFYDQDYKVSLARKHLLNETTWSIVNFDEIVPLAGEPEDLHDSTNVAISLNDKRIHLAYGHHNEDLRYRISEANAATNPNFTATLFGDERNYLKVGVELPLVTYPIFVTRPTDGKLFIFWREGVSGNGTTYMSDYLDNGTWSGKRKVIDGTKHTYVDPTGNYADSPTRNAYPNGIATFGNQMHLTWTWREAEGNQPSADPRTNHDLMYAKSTDGGSTWTNTAGTEIGNSGPGSTKMDLESPGITAVDISNAFDILNSGSTVVDSEGNTHVVIKHADAPGSTTDRYWHYKRIGQKWTGQIIGDASGPFAAGRRGTLFVDRKTDTLYYVTNVGNKVRIYASQRTTHNADDTFTPNWGTWHQAYISTTKYKNELNGRQVGDSLLILAQREGATPSAEFSPLEVLWLFYDSDPIR